MSSTTNIRLEFCSKRNSHRRYMHIDPAIETAYFENVSGDALREIKKKAGDLAGEMTGEMRTVLPPGTDGHTTLKIVYLRGVSEKLLTDWIQPFKKMVAAIREKFPQQPLT